MRRFGLTTLVAYFLVFGMPAVFFLIIGVVLGIVPVPRALVCLDETLKEMRNLSGYDFRIVDTSCGVIAKDDNVSVRISRAGGHENVELLLYDPVNVEPQSLVLPVISVSGQGEITISIERINEILVQETNWNGLPIRYEIGQITYPRPATTGQ